ncbi:MAG: tetratricopeptide repeat protein, partial [Thermoplasmata archaeon]|nr:tetratricopeptide repeat protein [Thermoplasmata archaeon]NIS12831.1 tetratricopeptide repeat protein [Thermoplasmata archaeon]NIS20736.1 tetratricopeptide repeat protein [Thermoplasmata archaeon]NIV79498.1 tetratricopeptide repeat protein [Thermoplasmata archaeon]NIW83309.1 tetratricopeptide repeat protein [Thermoplasmata archaeon]
MLQRVQEFEAEIGESAYFKYHQGLLLDEMGRPRRAVRMYARALELDDTDPEIWKAKGNAHFNLEELDLAIECYDEALERDIDNEEVWNNRGFTFFTAGFMTVAIDCYRQAV